jgi:predicted nucleic acid-binding protein
VAFLLDTNVAIHLRDGDPTVTQKAAALHGAVLMSIVTRVELEGSVYLEPAHAPVRRARLDAMLSAIPTLAFDDLAAKTYGTIVASAGYSRRKLLDRMIAAQALVHRATLVTRMCLVCRRWRGNQESQKGRLDASAPLPRQPLITGCLLPLMMKGAECQREFVAHP